MLNISYKSHAVMTITDFIEMHKGSSYRAPLDLDLVGREEELECARTLLKENQVVVLAGDSGCRQNKTCDRNRSNIRLFDQLLAYCCAIDKGRYFRRTYVVL